MAFDYLGRLIWALGIVGAVCGFGSGAIAQSQITPDGTTGSIVVPFNDDVDIINGGLENNGNLLHSFQDFNVAEERGVYFFSPSENIQTIFSSVTGDRASNILGTLGTTGNSAPALWLINPNGILFGPNAQLNLGGAFIATTANAIQRPGLDTIAASGIADNNDILTINESAFIFNRSNSNATIINQSQSPVISPVIPLSGFEDFRGLQVSPGRTLGLISKDILLDRGGLNTPNGTILLSATENIDLINGAAIQAGDILVNANRLSVQDGSQILTQAIDPRILDSVSYFSSAGTAFFNIRPDDFLQTLTAVEGGSISISAQESVEISGASDNAQNPSRIGSGALGALRTGGNITINTDRFAIDNGGQITSNYLSVSDENSGGGIIDIESPQIEISGSFIVPTGSNAENIERLSGIFIGSNLISPTNGSVDLASEAFNLTDGARISVILADQRFSENTPLVPGEINVDSASAVISGISPNDSSSFILANRNDSELTTPIIINSDSLTVQENSAILGQDVGIVAAQNIRLQDNARISSNKIELSTRDVQVQENSAIVGQGVGIVAAQNIRLQNNARISSNKIELSARDIIVQESAAIVGQDVEIVVDETVLIKDNSSISDIDQGIFERSEDTIIRVESENLSLQNSARVNSSEIELFARNSLEIKDISQVLTEDASLFNVRSESESIRLNASEITVSDNALVSSPRISISGGIATIQEQSRISANQQSYGNSGDISIAVNQLNILDSAQLSASIGRPGSGGSIDIEAANVVNIIGDRNAAQPSSIRATSDGPGTGGQVSIQTRQLDIQNGSQIVASLNGGGTGGSVSINAEESVNISGQSTLGLPSGIFADSDLNGGEFVVLRSVRDDNQSPQFISMLLDTEVILFTQTPSLIRSRPRTGNTGSNQIFLDYSPPDNDPRSAVSLFPKGEGVPRNQLTFDQSVGSGVQINEAEDITSENLGSTEVSTNQAILIESTAFLSQEVGSARQTLFSHLNVPDDGTLIVGQSINTNFSDSIQGGERIFPDGERIASLRSIFTDSLESVKDVALIDLEDIETDPDDFAGNRREGIFTDIDEINSAFTNNAGEFHVVESTGEEFRIQDEVYTDTRFTDIQSGDIFLIFAVRDGGDINIETGKFSIRGGAEISATSLGAAQGSSAASNLNISANSVLIENNARISSISETGTGGNISIQTPAFTLDNSIVTAEARANASGGNVTVSLPELSEGSEVKIINSRISSQSNQAGGGNVSLSARNITLEGNSDIETNVSTGAGDGGDITLSADYIIAFDDSDLFAFSGSGERRGNGGSITLNTPSFFGENFNAASLQAEPNTLRDNDRADINATGSVNGDVSVPDVRFIEDSLTDLPDNLIASEQLIASSCIARAEDGTGALVTNGNDGLASTPNSELSIPLSTGTVQAVSYEGSTPPVSNAQPDSVSIDEPTGVYQLADGRLVMGKACN